MSFNQVSHRGRSIAIAIGLATAVACSPSHAADDQKLATLGKSEVENWSAVELKAALQNAKAADAEQHEYVPLSNAEFKGVNLDLQQRLRLLELHILRTERFWPYSEQKRQDTLRVEQLRFLEKLDDRNELVSPYTDLLDELLLWQVGYDRKEFLESRASIAVRDDRGFWVPDDDHRKFLRSEMNRLERLRRHGRIDATRLARLVALQAYFASDKREDPRPSFHAGYAKEEAERRTLFALENADKNSALDPRDADELKALRRRDEERRYEAAHRERCCARRPPETDPVKIKMGDLHWESSWLKSAVGEIVYWPPSLAQEDFELETRARAGKLTREERALYVRLGQLKKLIPDEDEYKASVLKSSLERLNKDIVALGYSPELAPDNFSGDRTVREQVLKRIADEHKEVEAWKLELAQLRAQKPQ